MKESIFGWVRKEMILPVAAAGMAAAFLSGCGSDEEEAPPSSPQGMTRDIGDYKYLIIIDEGSGFHGELFTNEEPFLNPENGENYLVAQNVYCPDFNAWEQENFGCKEFVTDIPLKISQPKRIVIAPNPDFKGEMK